MTIMFISRTILYNSYINSTSLMFNMLLNFKKQKIPTLNFSHNNHNLYSTFKKYQNDLLPCSTASTAMASKHPCSSKWYWYFSEVSNCCDKGIHVTVMSHFHFLYLKLSPLPPCPHLATLLYHSLVFSSLNTMWRK